MSERSSVNFDEGSQIPEKVWKMQEVRGVISRAQSASLMPPLQNRHLGRRRTEHRLPGGHRRHRRCSRTQFPAAPSFLFGRIDRQGRAGAEVKIGAGHIDQSTDGRTEEREGSLVVSPLLYGVCWTAAAAFLSGDCYAFRSLRSAGNCPLALGSNILIKDFTNPNRTRTPPPLPIALTRRFPPESPWLLNVCCWVWSTSRMRKTALGFRLLRDTQLETGVVQRRRKSGAGRGK